MIILSCPIQQLDPNPPELPIDALIEYRLDTEPYLDNIPWSDFCADHILTYRNKGELSADEYTVLIELCYQLTSAIIDIDYGAWRASGKRPLGERFILSLHQDVIDLQQIDCLLQETTPLRYAKIAIDAGSWDEVLKVSARIAQSGRKDIIFSVMGRYGKLQRILHQALGSAAVFVYLDLPTASGQLHLEEVALYHCLQINSETQVFGIVGDESVNHSKSLQHYNELFRQDMRNAVYLPIPAIDMTEASSIIAWLQTRFSVIGLSITMPFKKSFPQSYGKSLIANTFQVSLQQFYNTDIIAFTWCLRELNICPQSTILIYGYGACAELFIRYLIVNGFCSIVVAGRNQARLQELCQRMEIDEYANTAVLVDLLVNCSPLGKAVGDDTQSLPSFHKLIDLAYGAAVTKLVQLAVEQEIPYVDGHTFWEQQFTAQYKLLIQ